jgi:leucyl-tRNA synthetase
MNRSKLKTLYKQKQIENQAVEDEKVKRYLEGKTIKKIIVIPERLVNIVVS